VQKRLLHNFTIINATSPNRHATLQVPNQGKDLR
jgi:hypothetical protein